MFSINLKLVDNQNVTFNLLKLTAPYLTYTQLLTIQFFIQRNIEII